MPIGDSPIGDAPIGGEGSVGAFVGYFDFLHWCLGWGSCVAPVVTLPIYPGAGLIDRGGPTGFMQKADRAALLERAGQAGIFLHGGLTSLFDRAGFAGTFEHGGANG